MRVPISFWLQDQMEVGIDGTLFLLFLKEDSYCMLRRDLGQTKHEVMLGTSLSSDERWMEDKNSGGD